jgi:hypothetical protein
MFVIIGNNRKKIIQFLEKVRMGAYAPKGL